MQSGGGNIDRNAGAPAPAPATIDVLITFDKRGVSGHPNHSSLYFGAVAWLKDMMRGKAGWECPVSLYTLTSISLMRKYLSVLDAPFTMLQCVLQSVGPGKNGGGAKGRVGKGEMGREKGTDPGRLFYMADLGAYRRGQRAMTQAHRSQMVWFRWGWISLGRYMVVNDLKRERI